MASTTSTLITIPLLLLIVLSLSASSVSARPGRPFHPCNTLLISTYSLSFNNPHNNNDNNPRFFALVAHLRFLHPKPPLHPLFIEGDDVTFTNPSFFLRRQQEDRPPLRPIPHRPATPPLRASFLHRGLDVLNVAASLLFGAACGALTAGTMYFLWSLFSTGPDADLDDDDDDAYRSLDGSSDEDDDHIFNPKKPVNVYAAVPLAADAVKVDVPTDESV